MLGKASFVLTLAAGAIISAGAQAQSRRIVTTETVIEDVAAAATNGGINPAFFAYTISGRVKLGGNRCQARGVTAELKTVQRAGTIMVIPVLKSPADAGSRICTMEFAPVFAEIGTTVRGNSQRVRDVVVANVGTIGHSVSVQQLMALGRQEGEETVLTHVVAQPINGGINPDAFAYAVSGAAMKGANPCEAANTEVRLVETREGSEIRVKAIRRTIDQNRNCTREFNPQYVELSLTVRGFSSQTSAVVIENVDTLGHDVDASELP